MLYHIKKYKSLEAVEFFNSFKAFFLVRQTGIEPAAFTFGVCYSIP